MNKSCYYYFGENKSKCGPGNLKCPGSPGNTRSSGKLKKQKFIDFHDIQTLKSLSENPTSKFQLTTRTRRASSLRPGVSLRLTRWENFRLHVWPSFLSLHQEKRHNHGGGEESQNITLLFYTHSVRGPHRHEIRPHLHWSKLHSFWKYRDIQVRKQCRLLQNRKYFCLSVNEPWK